MADSTSASVDSPFTSGSINVSGLGNGTDFNALIDGLITAEKVHINRLTAWKNEWTSKVTQFQNLNTKMLSLKTTLTFPSTGFRKRFLLSNLAFGNFPLRLPARTEYITFGLDFGTGEAEII